MSVESVADFQELVARVEAQTGYARPAAFGVGLANQALLDPTADDPGATGGAVLDTWFPAPNCAENYGTAAVLAHIVGHTCGSASYRLDVEALQQALSYFAPFENDGQVHGNIDALRAILAALTSSMSARKTYAHTRQNFAQATPRIAVVTFIQDIASAPVDIHDAYLRLHLLSCRKIRPHGCSLEGIFGKLTNVAWTNLGPFAAEGFERVRTALRGQGITLLVHSVDKFPRMTDYVVPSGVRIADADRVRLGAHLSEGTTVMHEGFVNFNAGTLGSSMVEGRISAGVVIGNGTDIGGSASIMGTLSGGGKKVISVGENCLLGANSGCGIPLGNNCTIEAGCYVTAGSKVKMPDGSTVKASELAGKNDLLFLRNSVTGSIEVRFKKNTTMLNEELHKN